MFTKWAMKHNWTRQASRHCCPINALRLNYEAKLNVVTVACWHSVIVNAVPSELCSISEPAMHLSWHCWPINARRLNNEAKLNVVTVACWHSVIVNAVPSELWSNFEHRFLGLPFIWLELCHAKDIRIVLNNCSCAAFDCWKYEIDYQFKHQ